MNALHPLLLLFSLLLGGCANVPSDYKFTRENDEGLIVGSITYDATLGRYELLVKPPNGVRPPRLNVGYANWPPLGPLMDDALKVRGGTFAVAVPPGDYEIVGWRIVQGVKHTRPTKAIRIPFVVEKGKASYVGNLHFDDGWKASLRDMAERDLPILAERYEALKTAPIAFSTAKGLNLEDLGGEYSSKFEPPIIFFIPVRR